MAVSASAKSRAAAVSALISRDAGFHVTPKDVRAGRRFTGIVVRAAMGRDGWPSITVSDPYDRPADHAEARHVVSYRREYIERHLRVRGYWFDLEHDEAANVTRFVIWGKRNARSTKEHKVELTFTIDLEAARAYLGNLAAEDDGERGLAAALAGEISEMIQASNAYQAIQVLNTKFVR